MSSNKYNTKIQDSDMSLFELSNIFCGNMVWINRGIDNDIATFDLVIREMPENWNFYCFYGLNRFLDILLSYKFNKDDIKLLKRMNFINSDKTEKFYKNFKFSGDVLTLRDGTIFFPGEPIVRITAPVCQANLFTTLTLDSFSYPIRLLSKSLRVKLAINNTIFIGGSLVRLPGFEQGSTVMEVGYMLDSPIVSPLFYKKYSRYKQPDGKINININHAFIKSFNTEREAYRYALDVLFPKSGGLTSVMIDTYDLKKGLETFIEEIKKTKNITPGKLLIAIDSGDLYKLSIYVRNRLNKSGLQKMKIQVMSNLDEYSISDMVKKKAPVDLYAAATEVVNITDNPKFEAVYKMAELRRTNGSIEQKAKLTKGKESYPGRKQIFRVYKNDLMQKDIIGLENEKLGEPLLVEYIKNGKLIGKLQSLDETKKIISDQIKKLPNRFKDIFSNKNKYKIVPSKKLIEMLNKVKKQHIS